MREHALLDVASAAAETSGNVLDDNFAHVVVKDLVEECAWLLVVGVGVIVSIAANDSIVRGAFPRVALVFHRSAERVRLVVNLRSLVSVVREAVTDHV